MCYLAAYGQMANMITWRLMVKIAICNWEYDSVDILRYPALLSMTSSSDGLIAFEWKENRGGNKNKMH